MSETTVPAPPPPPKPIVRYQLIRLTNRSPIRIVDSDWPIMATGVFGDDDEDMDAAPCGFQIRIEVRHEHIAPHRIVISAEYRIFNDDAKRDFKRNQTVRVGRLLTTDKEHMKLWGGHIAAVGDQLRQRILAKGKRKYVTLAIDRCFADLSPWPDAAPPARRG